MMNLHSAVVMAALLCGTPAYAQSTPAESTTNPTPIDATRLAAATAMLDVVLPPDTRDAMLDQMVGAMMNNMTSAVVNDPTLAALFDGDPDAKALLTRFVTRQQDASIKLMKESLPEMVTAMARAYARGMSVTELDDTTRFLKTPSGKAYLGKSMTIMVDPDVVAWQQAMMKKAMARMPSEIEALVTEATALAEKKKKKS